MTDTALTAVWHNDGHWISLLIDRAQLIVSTVDCPGGSECQHERIGCIVKYFIETYGLECNVGIIEPQPQIQIAWTAAGDIRDIDACQIWIIPSEDEAFAAWAATQ